MAYLEEFQLQITNHDSARFLHLWEEYCNGDSPDPEELVQILKLIRESDMAPVAGKYIEAALPLWQLVTNLEQAHEILSLILDIQTTNSQLLAETAMNVLTERYKGHQHFNEKIRLVGLRHKHNFQGALRNFELLTHLDKGRFVLHTGGWGVGEVMDLSLVREELTVEFENLGARRQLTFQNAFKNLSPLPDEHFLARRFADPDKLEAETKKDPVGVVKTLLRDCGPMTAAEIKDEMCVLVIPEEDWTKWWQSARSKLKKDTMIETPRSVREPFRLRTAELTHESRFQQRLDQARAPMELLQVSYNFVRDIPDLLKDQELHNTLIERFDVVLADSQLSEAQRLEITLFCEQHLNHKVAPTSVEMVLDIGDLHAVVDSFSILALKKRALAVVRKQREDWPERFVELLETLPQNPLRDYLLGELVKDGEGLIKLEETLERILRHPARSPALVVWYTQKALASHKIPLSDNHGRCRLFEAFLTVYHSIELRPEHRELVKKMYAIISNKRYAAVRSILEHSTVSEAKEFLLLVSKCQTLSDHDKKIFSNLVEVVHPSLSDGSTDDEAITYVWTTEEAYQEAKDQVEHLTTVEVVDNAREIEEARALGDLRENAEYKAALERRSRLQADIKRLSDQLNRARVITPEDIDLTQVSVGTVVEVKGNAGITRYTILGPWDADVDNNILSFQSRLAEALIGMQVGDTIEFNSEILEIAAIHSYLETAK